MTNTTNTTIAATETSKSRITKMVLYVVYVMVACCLLTMLRQAIFSKNVMEAFAAKNLISNLIVATCVGYIFYVRKAKPKKKKDAPEE